MTSVGAAKVETGGNQRATARYVYCVVPLAGVSVGHAYGTGLDGQPVYQVSQGRIAVLVHDCPAEPYRPADRATVERLVLAHHSVVEAAFEEFGCVLPMTFNSIVAASQDKNAAGNLAVWLESEQDLLVRRLDALRGKAEYGLHVSWPTSAVLERVRRESAEIRRLEDEVGAKSPGAAYLLRQKLELTLKREAERWTSELYATTYRKLQACSEQTRIDKASTADGGQETAVNFSCLIQRDRVEDLQRMVDELAADESLCVRLVGPLPPYSFCRT